jgi:acetate kinase
VGEERTDRGLACRDCGLSTVRFSSPEASGWFALFSVPTLSKQMADSLYLAVNCGSSSIKFKVYSRATQVLVAGSASNVQGDSPASFKFAYASPTSSASSSAPKLTQKKERTLDSSTSYEAVFEEILNDVTSEEVLGQGAADRITVVAHRIVHGGTAKEPVLIKHGDKGEKETLERMNEVSDFAPLHVRTSSLCFLEVFSGSCVYCDSNRTTTQC